jgi:hypothetical protein
MSDQSQEIGETREKRLEAKASSTPGAASDGGVIKDQQGQKVHDRAFAIAHQDDKTLSRPEMMAIQEGETVAEYNARIAAIQANPLKIEGKLSASDTSGRRAPEEKSSKGKQRGEDLSPSHLNLKAIAETDSALKPVLNLRDHVLQMQPGQERDELEKLARQQEMDLLTPEVRALRDSKATDITNSTIASNIVPEVAVPVADTEPSGETIEPDEIVAWDGKQMLRDMGDAALEKAGFFVHRGREDDFIDYKASQKAWKIAGLDELGLPKNIIGAIMRNEQHFYKRTDEEQDEQVRKKGTVYSSNGKEDTGASIGPAQMQIERIRHLINLKTPNGKTSYEFLAPLQIDSIRAALKPENAALLVGAHLREIESDQRRHGVKVTSAEKIIYGYNDDVNSYLEGGSRQFTSVLNSADVAAQRVIHRDLRREKYPTDERILEASVHVRNVMAQLEHVNSICP